MQAAALTDSQLVDTLKQLIAREHVAIADVVEHLAEVDARKLHVVAGCSSLTAYCQQRLGYSQYEAGYRVTAARLVRQYPMILAMLQDGSLCLSTLRTIAPVLNAANHRERLEAAANRTRSDVELLVAGWSPKPDVPTRIVPLKAAEPPALLSMMAARADILKTVPSRTTDQAAPAPASQPPSRPAPLPQPLTPERFKLEVTIDAETREDLMKLRDHMRHAIPDGDVAKIIKRALKRPSRRGRSTQVRQAKNRETEDRKGANRATTSRATETRITANRITEHRITENRTTDNRITDNRITENRITEHRTTEHRPRDLQLPPHRRRRADAPRPGACHPTRSLRPRWRSMLLHER